jgi:hypothetical protein
MSSKTKHTAVRAIAVGVVANFAFAALVAGSQAGPGYLAVDDWTADAQGVNGVRLTAATDGTIPKRPDAYIGGVLIAGIAWADLGTGKALVATIHPVAGRDSYQRPDAWHLHTVTLTSGTGASDFCVVSIDSTPTAGISVNGSAISVNLDRSSMPGIGGGETLDPSAIDVASGFIVASDNACGSTLGVVLLT